MWVLFGHLYLSGVWVSEDQRRNTIRHMFERDWTTLSNFITNCTVDSEQPIENTHVRSQGINKHSDVW
jgi:hypothetical protein